MANAKEFLGAGDDHGGGEGPHKIEEKARGANMSDSRSRKSSRSGSSGDAGSGTLPSMMRNTN